MSMLCIGKIYEEIPEDALPQEGHLPRNLHISCSAPETFLGLDLRLLQRCPTTIQMVGHRLKWYHVLMVGIFPKNLFII